MNPDFWQQYFTGGGGTPNLGELIAGVQMPQPPQMPGGMPGAMPSVMPGMMPGAAVAPGAAPQAAGFNPQAIGQMLQGVQRPAPVAPLMSGGVSGAQKAPEMGVHAGQQSAMMTALMKLLQGRQNPMVAPSLGALISR